MLSSFCSVVARVPRAATTMQLARMARPAAPAALAAPLLRSFSSAPAAAAAAESSAAPLRKSAKQRKTDALNAAKAAHQARALKAKLPVAERKPLQRMRARVHRQGQAPPKPLYLTAQQHGQIMNRSFRGIFAGKHVHFGNMVSHSTRRYEHGTDGRAGGWAGGTQRRREGAPMTTDARRRWPAHCGSQSVYTIARIGDYDGAHWK